MLQLPLNKLHQETIVPCLFSQSYTFTAKKSRTDRTVLFLLLDVNMYQTSGVKVHTITTGETFGADKDLLSKVKRRVQLTVTHWMESLFIIVFCPITSRVGSDVEAAMTKVPGDQNVILVLMHHTRDEGYSTAGVSWSDRYRNVILDVHVLFHETVPGLLLCAKNTEAVDQMIHELDQRSQNQQIGHIRPRERGLINKLDECCFPYWKIVLPFVVVVLFILLLVIFLA
ncbi:uncharacterized protein LOC114147991 isoform X2 [Xiphophorus couchianus]|uniref:uncharacterized protein LOC114147991 isoform X2 n=1 Tax=Xiphophorus couchianus TaxID=32473 RepID=UPI0010168E1C|nr:uncharacterized protein LOC114147991 isoform X2 [Xiphophorus couchianus]